MIVSALKQHLICISLSIVICLFGCTAHPQKSSGTLALYAELNNDTLQQVVADLKNYLKKSSNINFAVFPLADWKGDGMRLLNTQQHPRSTSVTFKEPEAFLISGNTKSLTISASSNLGLRHGVYAWLEKLGFRFYFAHPDWHIIPLNPLLFSDIDVQSKPAYEHRRIFYEWGTGSEKADKDFITWQHANKLGGTLNADFGHAYDEIVLRNAEEFKKNPEWLFPVPPKGTLPENPKLDMSNERLVQFVIKDVLKRIEASYKSNKPIKMISMSASDARGTCATPACLHLGSITDRVYYLVNRVAKAVRQQYPTVNIGCLAYDEYGDPPAIAVEPNVYVAITTAFNSSKYPTPELVRRWKAKGVKIGIYDYFSQFTFDYDIPGQSQVSEINKLARNIRYYHSLGATGYDGQSSQGWISKGLGYYVMAKVMWDLETDVTGLKEEFFKNCFGKASATLKELWIEWERYAYVQVRESDLARWIDMVFKAETEENSPLFRNRIFQIKTYLNYLHLYNQYKKSATSDHLLSLLEFGNRTLDIGTVIGYPMFYELGQRSGFPGMGYSKEAKWRRNESPVSHSEINNQLKGLRKTLKASAPFKTYELSTSFKNVPLRNIKSSMVEDSARSDNGLWLKNEWVVEIPNNSESHFIEITGDYIGDASNVKPIRILFFNQTTQEDYSDLKAVFIHEYSKKKVKEKISLDKLKPGYYTLIIEDPVKIFRLKFSPSVNHSMVMRPKRHIQATQMDYAFFYVPEGVRSFNIAKGRVLTLISPAGRTLVFDNQKETDISVTVNNNESGLWRIKLLADRLFIEGIPPYIGTSPSQMLIPRNLN